MIMELFFASLLYQQGVDLYSQKKYPEAIAVLEKAVETEDAHDVEVNYLLGLAYLQTRDADKAETAFARLFGMPANSAAAHLLTAELLLKREYRKEALLEAQKALALDPKLPGTHFLLGQMALFNGSLDEAMAEMSKELEINPNFSMAWYRLWEILARQEKWQAAIANLERAIWLNADFSGPYIVLGRCYFKTGNYGNAEGVLRHALTLDPNNYAATNLLGQTLVAENKMEEGRVLLEKLKGMERK